MPKVCRHYLANVSHARMQYDSMQPIKEKFEILGKRSSHLPILLDSIDSALNLDFIELSLYAFDFLAWNKELLSRHKDRVKVV